MNIQYPVKRFCFLLAANAFLLSPLFGQVALSAQPSTDSATPARVTIQLPNGKAADIPQGPFAPSWESIKQNYQVPQWFLDGKFGIFIHWGVYSVAAHASEWYPRHMYSNSGVAKWHTEKFGPPDQFGYKDIIPLFKAEKFNPDEWAALFKKAGAKYVVPTAEHHDGFAMYHSELTKWDAKDMGPKRDLIGDLGGAVRKQGLKFGVSNHRMEHWDFMYPQLQTPNDLFDPAYADFYGPPQPPPQRKAPKKGEEVMEDQDKAPQSQAFLEEWLARCQELVDQYQPDMVWFDNGVNSRSLDSIKLRFAAYYYNRAAAWGKPVSISTKSDAYLAGSVRDFERQGRAPKELTNYHWQVDDPIGEKFGYVEGMKITNVGTVVRRLVENVSKNGNLMLNISPKGDGTIPEEQKQVLLGVGQWLEMNGEAIYGTRAWTTFGEDAPRSASASATDKSQVHQPSYRFTTKGNDLYAIALGWPEKVAVITLLAKGKSKGKIKRVTLLGHQGKLKYTQDEEGLKVEMPVEKTGEHAYSLKISGVLADKK